MTDKLKAAIEVARTITTSGWGGYAKHERDAIGTLADAAELLTCQKCRGSGDIIEHVAEVTNYKACPNGCDAKRKELGL